MINPFSIKARADNAAEIYIYGDIGESWFSESVTASQFVRDLAAIDAERIAVRINSYGGSVTDGLAIYNALKRHSATIEVTIDGMAASIASLIAMAGSTVTMAENALLMIHAPWTGVVGNAVELREMADLLDKYAQSAATSYAKKTARPIEEMTALLTDGEDHWYSAAEALEAGFIDEITDALPIAASYHREVAQRYPSFPSTSRLTQGVKLMPEKERTAFERAMNMPLKKAEDEHPPIPEPSPSSQLDSDAIRDQAIRAETTRRADIKAKFKGFASREGVSDLAETCLDDPRCTVKEACDRLLAHLAKDAEPIQGRHVSAGLDARDKYRLGASAMLRARAGLHEQGQRIDLSGNQYRGYSLTELARASLEQAGVRTGHMSKMELVAAAFTHTSSDFGNLLADVAQKSLLKGYEEAEETFQAWTATGELPDFKPAKRVGLDNFPALSVVPEGAEYTYATVGDRGETIQIATYGKMFSITRQAIINDDLRAFTTIPRKMGMAAIRTVGNLVYAVLTSNPIMSDGTALFHANHGNLLTGTTINTASVDAMRVAMGTQKDGVGANLNIGLSTLIVPKALEGTARVVQTSEFEVGSSSRNNTTPNAVRGTFEIIADARLDANSATAWYGVANASIHDVVEVAYLEGQDRPYLEQQEGWQVDGAAFKVRIDAGVKALDFRTLAKNPGA
jgi:ATP-dependent Clp endopeptidase proteolytic subunit ClpP